jgi:biopolymer transport protein ExbB
MLMVYKGGPIVPVLLGLLLMVVVFSFERCDFKSIGNLDQFMTSVQRISKLEILKKQSLHVINKKGSVANLSNLLKYQEVKERFR